MPIICTTCGHRREPQDSGPAAICPKCQMPYTAAAIREQTPEPDADPGPSPAPPMKISWPAAVRVDVVDFDIPFLSLVWLFFKAALAAIPAAIMVAVAWFVFFAAMGWTPRL